MIRLLPVTVALASVLAACQCPNPSDGPDAGDSAASPDAALDSGVVDARTPDARPEAGLPADAGDAGPWPDATQHEFCDQPFFKLPIDGQSQGTVGIDLQEGRLVWTRTAEGEYLVGNIHGLDLSTCLERTLTMGAHAGKLYLHGEEVIHDDSDEDTGMAFCSDLYSASWVGGPRQRLTESPVCELEPRTNGRHVLYSRLETLDDPASLRLWDRQTSEYVELAPAPANVESFDLNDEYAVWVAYTSDPLSVGRDLYYRDLGTGETFHLDATYDRWQHWTFLWDDWVTIKGGDNFLSPPFFLGLLNLVTQEERSLLEDDYAVGSGHIDAGLIVYNTSRYTGTTNLFPSDLEIYEIATGTTRRLTTVDGYVAVQRLAYPYLLILRFMGGGMYMNDFYVANLVALGVTDGLGNLIPGDPVIETP